MSAFTIRMAFVCTALAVAEAVPNPVHAQVERLELGQRLRRFELAWGEAGEAERAASVAPMERAVRSFFSLQLATAGRWLDTAWFAARSGTAPDPMTKAIVSLHPDVRPLIVDPAAGVLHIRLSPFYETGLPLPDTAEVFLYLSRPAPDGPANGPGPEMEPTARFALRDLLQGVDWQLPGLAGGDWLLTCAVRNDGALVPAGTRMISLVDQCGPRLDALAKGLEASRDALDATIFATVTSHLDLLRSLQAGDVPETSYPADHLLREAEDLLRKQDPGDYFRNAARERDTWMTLAAGRKRVAVRVRAPAQGDGPWPVLFLFHGAGGSENMFFETYGAGQAVAEGVRRGWLVVAPRQGLTGLSLDCAAMLKILQRHFPVDPARVLLAGHSMGAGQVMRQAALHAGLPRAVAAIGGGGPIRDAAAVSRIPWFVAAGERDFGRSGAMALARSLQAAGAPVEYLEVPAVEHMVIVQAVLPDLFRFLDAQLAKENR